MVEESFMLNPSESDSRNVNEEPFINVTLTRGGMCFVPIHMSF